MKRSGIIRKIDNLGRIVIPREIRSLLELKTGDEMEISVENNAVVFVKTNMDFCLEKYAERLGKKVHDTLKVATFITGKDEVLAAFGESLDGVKLTKTAKEIVSLPHYTSFNGGAGVTITENGKKYYAEIFVPILKNGVSVGSVIIGGDDNFTLSDLKYLRLGASVLEIIVNEK